MSNSALFACSKCLTRHPFEELSSGQQLCKDCRGPYPVLKCTYCRSEFQQTVKDSSICSKCRNNCKQFGKPSACEYCNIIAAFIGNKCQRCTNSEMKYGAPVTCEQCKQKCAFDRKDDDKKVDGKLLCWLCTLSFKRALAKTKRGDAERRASAAAAAHMKLSSAQRQAKMKDGRVRGQKRSSSGRVDLTKDVGDRRGGDGEAGPHKAARPHNHRPPGDPLDPNSSDHVVAMTQLKEQMASLQKQLVQKDAILLSKDKMITELKAKHFTTENEIRTKMKNEKNEYEKKVEMLSGKVKSLQKEVATLSKSVKKNSINRSEAASAAAVALANSGTGSGGSGTDSPLP